MQPNQRSTSNLILLGLIFSGCAASFDPRLSSLVPTENGLPTVEQAQPRQEVSARAESPVAGQDFGEEDPGEPFNEETFPYNRQSNGSIPKSVASRDDQELGNLVSKSVRNAFDNLDVVRRLTNNIFQVDFAGASQELIRFAINSTISVGGLFDVAEDVFGIEQSDRGDWVILKWMEKPARNGPSTLAKPEDRTEFRRVVSFDHREYNDKSWQAVKNILEEGDLIAYKEDKWEARTKIFLKGELNKIGYRLFKYGHAAIVVRDPDDGRTFRLLSTQSFKGPNIREDIDTLKYYSWDSYRLNRWDRVDKKRFYEFIDLVQKKAGTWYGYDFSGMFGLWNSNLNPSSPEDVGYEYMCSTVIVAALYYAGVELDASQRHGVLDIITPLQLVRSTGRVISLPY